jgi:Phage portal protein, SPP1 Gp6-like
VAIIPWTPPQPLVGYDPIELVVDLDEALSLRQPDLDIYQDYYDGDHPLLFASEKWRRAFGGLFHEFSDNWCALVVDAVEERLDVEGFRFGSDEGDDDAWAIWQANGLDADSQIAHTDALIHGVSYALVWADEQGQPKIDIESPLQTIVVYDPGRRRTRLAGFKRWMADDHTVFGTLYMPDYLWKFQAKAPGGSPSSAPRMGGWQPRDVDDEPWPLPNPLGVVPLVPLVNRPRLLPRRYISVEGTSELKQVIPVQDAVNKLLLDMLVASEFGAFRQRWVTGMDIPRDPDTDAPVEPFKAAVDRLWMAEDPAVKFGEFAATDLTAYVKSTEMLVQHIASQTRTPPHYFYLSGQFPSGESIKSAETGLVAKARRKMRHFEEGWEEMIRLSFRVLGDPRADFVGAETIWADPESRTEGEHVDATLKKKALDVPIQQLWEDLGYSPQQIGRFREMLAEQAFLAALAAPPAPEPGPPPPEVP